MMSVAVEMGLVCIRFNYNCSSVLLPIDDAMALADDLETASKQADFIPSTLFRNEPWEVNVQSYDGKVGISFSRATNRVPLPPKIARRLAEKIRYQAEWAKWKMRVSLNPVRC